MADICPYRIIEYKPDISDNFNGILYNFLAVPYFLDIGPIKKNIISYQIKLNINFNNKIIIIKLILSLLLNTEY